MSDMGMPQGTMSSAGNANFDSGGMGQGKDPWGRPIKQNNSGGDGGDGNKDPKNDNNGGIDDDLVANIFEKIENKGNNDNQNNGNNGQQGPVNQGNSGDDAKARLDTYLKDNGLGGINISDAEKEAATNGDFGPLMANINNYVVNSHMKALSGSQTMIQKAVEDAVAKVTEKANANYQGNKNLDIMREKLPYTKEKHIAPVAATLLQRALDRGLPAEKAVEVVDMYFNDISSRVGGGKVNTNRNQGFGSNFNSDKKMNWVDILSPGNG